VKRTVRSYKNDANQDAVVDALLADGCLVQILGCVGGGCPDILAAKHGRLYLLEVKKPGEDLTPAQQGWHKHWAGYVSVVTSPEDALAVVRGND
jgi:hypothetical protein